MGIYRSESEGIRELESWVAENPTGSCGLFFSIPSNAYYLMPGETMIRQGLENTILVCAWLDDRKHDGLDTGYYHQADAAREAARRMLTC